MTRPPNVLFVFADEWRAQATGYAGDPNCDTPALDAFARRSINVTHAVSGCPVCCPYRASLMTGQYPLTHGVFINDVELDPDCASLARAFAAGGYRTSYIGKWHLHGSPEGRNERRGLPVPRSHQLGFDDWLGFECTHNYQKSPFFQDGDPTRLLWSEYRARWSGAPALSDEQRAYDAFPQTLAALDVLADRAADGRPGLCMLSWGPPHFPLETAPPSYQDRYRDRTLVLRDNVPADLRDVAQAELRGYYAHIAALDDCLGMLLDGLGRLGLADDTIVVFTADHGDMRQSQGLETKLFPWDESIRVPFLIRDPRHPGMHGRRLDALIDSPDLMPTLLGGCGLPIPATVEGRDWSAELAGRRPVDPHHDALLLVAGEITELRFNGMRAWRGLRTLSHTYVRSSDGPWLLYDNIADPFQRRNLIADPASQELRERLDHRLWRRLAERGDTFPTSDELLRSAGLSHYREATSPLRATWVDPWIGRGA
jgi:arylsulfatase A-like enzyme